MSGREERLARKQEAALALQETLRGLGATVAPSGRRGQVELALVSNLGTRFRLRLDPRAWPWEAPRAFVVEPAGPAARIHQWQDGALCLSLPGWDPHAPDVAGLLAALSAWVALYERYRLTGRGWAGEARSPAIEVIAGPGAPVERGLLRTPRGRS